MKLSISADSVLEAVTRQEEFSDFGDARYVDRYKGAMQSFSEEVELHPAGVALIENWSAGLLSNALRMQRDLAEHPEILDEVIAPPIVISGFARAGTTKLQRIVSASPATQSLKFWKALNPAPFPGADPQERDPRIAAAEELSRMIEENFPDLWAAHQQLADDAEEDFFIMDLTFNDPVIGFRFGDWPLTKALTPIDVSTYEFLKTTLKYLQWQDRGAGRSRRPWVLKSPIHIGNVATIEQVFPGAKFIFCHRDVPTMIASVCSLLRFSALMVTDTLDAKAWGQETLKYWAGEWDRNLLQRAQLDPASCMDMHFRSINQDGVAAAEKVHAFAGLTFDDAARKAAQGWEAANPRHRGGKHAYSLAEFGLTEDDVRNAFANYYDYFAGSDLLSAEQP